MEEQTHICSSMPAEAVNIHRAEHFINDDYWKWCLVISREATEEDLLENAHLEIEGDIMWQTSVGISHCPFCGVLLPDAAIGSEDILAEFNHSDHQRW